ncbi:MAG: ABC transporter transmembrane domain-containing protein [Dongiaceae bacterium]
MADHLPIQRIGMLRQLWPFIRPYRSDIFFASLAIMVSSGAVLAFGMGLRNVVDQGLSSANTAHINIVFLTLLAIIVVLAMAGFARLYFVNRIGEGVIAGIRRALYEHLLTLDAPFFETAKTGEIVARLTSDAAQIQTVVGTSLPIALRNGLLLLGAGSMLVITSAKLTGLVLLVAPLVLIPLIFLGRKVRKLSRLAQDRIADVSVYLDESLHFIKTVQAFTHEAIDQAHFSQRVERAFDAALSRTRLRALLSSLLIGLVLGAIAIVLWLGAYSVIEGTLSGGELAAFVFYAVVVAGSVAALSEITGELQRAAGSTERIIELLDTAPVIVTLNPVALPLPHRGEIEFKEVSFTYPARPGHLILQNINFTVKTGEQLGIIGPSGSGKTTIFQLLLRFYDPAQGQILIDGIDCKNILPQELRKSIGLVSQDPVIFSTSLRENILYGRPEANEDELRHACAAALIDEFLPRLPEGLDTFVGEKGVRLSGGQRQRISIARAILRNPPILLLDEATSQLDQENESLVQQALYKLMQKRTTLVITHRLSTLRNADRIMVLEHGKLTHQGKPAEILDLRELPQLLQREAS